MKVMAFTEARTGLKDAVEASQSDKVIITVHGRPAAVLIGVRGKTFDDLYLASPEFWSTLETRQRSARPMTPLEDVEQRLAARTPRRVRRRTTAKGR